MNDTIVAISTSLGASAISIVRLSGSEAINIASQIYKGKDLSKVSSHTINYGHIYDGDRLVDEVLLSLMKAPKTYTGEDIVEINCHGGVISTKEVLSLCLLKGARLATKGEFTRRAYENGKIDLIQAEAISDLLEADTAALKNVSLNNLNGKLSKLINEYRKNIADLITQIEVNIDYPEYEDIEVVTKEEIKEKMIDIKRHIEELLKTSGNAKFIKDGINTLIIGRPNVGKSSILNKLLEEEKAIVTNIPGTTRDIVEGSLVLEGFKLNLLDTAGIRKTDDVIEQIGVDKSLSYIDESDLVILVLNNNEKLTSDDKVLLDKTKDKKRIIVINKDDLETKINLEGEDYIKINTLDHEGIDKLKAKITELFNLNEIETSDNAQMVNIRQETKLREALDLVYNIERGLEDDIYIDMLEIDLKRIWDILGEIIGKTYHDEIIDEIFSRFCLGK